MLGAPAGPAAEASASGGEASFLVLQKGGKLPPFFAGGSHPRYRELARRLGHDQPVYQLDIYALQSQRLSQGLAPYEKIEDMAACYVRQLQAVQPHGPYMLGGGCEGAYEIGRAHVLTPVTNAHLVCRLLLEKKKTAT